MKESEYVIERINGQKRLEVEQAIAALQETKAAVVALVNLLQPRDFEILVDLVFSTSGWRRVGPVGGPQRMLDVDLVLPSTGERAFVQIKSNTNQAELDKYAGKLQEFGPYDRMSYVYHSGRGETDDERVTLIGPEKLAEMVVDTGLVNWLINRVL